jgi:hypothetical protein
MSDNVTKRLKCCVVEHTVYDEKIVHIENISFDMASMLVNIMNKEYDSYFTVEDMED